MFKEFKDEITDDDFTKVDNEWRKKKRKNLQKIRCYLALISPIFFGLCLYLILYFNQNPSYQIDHIDFNHIQVQARDQSFTFLVQKDSDKRIVSLGIEYPSLTLWLKSTVRPSSRVLYYPSSSNTFLPHLLNSLLTEGGSLDILTHTEPYKAMLIESKVQFSIIQSLIPSSLYDIILIQKDRSMPLPLNTTHTDIIYIDCQPILTTLTHTPFTITHATTENNKAYGPFSHYSIREYDATDRKYTLLAAKGKAYALCGAPSLYSLPFAQTSMDKQSLVYLIEYFRRGVYSDHIEQSVVLHINEPYLFIVLSRIVTMLYTGSNGAGLQKYCNYLEPGYFLQSIEHQSKSTLQASVGIYTMRDYAEDNPYSRSIVEVASDEDCKRVSSFREKYDLKIIDGKSAYRCQLTPFIVRDIQTECSTPFYVEIKKRG